MPTWTSNVTNVPDIQRKKQSFDDALNSINQFAGIMYQFQQAKQAELIKNITVTSTAIDKMPKNLQPEATKNILFPLINKAMPGIFPPGSFDFGKIVDVPKAIQGMDKFKNDPVGLQKYTASLVNVFTTDEYKAIEETKKSMLEANKQAKINELAGIASGVTSGRNLPTDISSQIAQGLYQVPEMQKFTKYTPQEQQRANVDLAAINPTLAEKFFQQTGITAPKRTHGTPFVNDKGEQVVPMYNETGEFMGTQKVGQTKPEKITVSKIGGNGEVSTKEISPVNLGEHLKSGWREGKITGVESSLDIEGKQLSNTLKRQAKQANETKAVLSKSPYYADAYRMTAEKHKDIPAAFDEADRIKQYAAFVNDLEQNVQLLERRFQTGKQPAPKTPPPKGRTPLGKIFGGR